MSLRYCVGAFLISVLWTQPMVASGTQSLAAAARKESERRKRLQAEGISSRVIENHDVARLAIKGNLSVSPHIHRDPGSSDSTNRKSRGSAGKFRTTLKKLDRKIRQVSDRLVLLEERAAKERRAPTKPGLLPGSRSASAERRHWQLKELELKLRRLRDERLDTYNTGLKAGFLPGELDGKGIVP